MIPIAHIITDFSSKFGIPRQSGLVEGLEGLVIFEPEFRNPDAVRGLDGYSHIWLLWDFSAAHKDTWSATVRPPRLGGNTRVGVFATRSPYRPNPIGLSSVRLLSIDDGPVLRVSGVDMLSGTPIFDIKPYIPFVDSHPDATGGFADIVKGHSLDVVIPDKLIEIIPCEKRKSLIEVLKNDPRPSYQYDSDRKYGLEFAGFDVKFTVFDNLLTVFDIVRLT